MTEPITIPEPTRIKPERTRPKKDDPWSVPAPKVKPTPKAYEKEIMKTFIDDYFNLVNR